MGSTGAAGAAGTLRREGHAAGFRTAIRQGLTVVVNGTAQRRPPAHRRPARRDRHRHRRGPARRDGERLDGHRHRPEEGRRPAAERPQLHAARHPDPRRRRASGRASAGQAGDATPGGFGNTTGGFNVNGMRNQSNNFLHGRRQQQRHLQHRVRPAPAPRRDPGVQDPHALLQRRVRPQRRARSSTSSPQPGTNQLHGAAWEFNRDDSLQARNFFAPGDPGQARS